jgi:phenylpyruvate tautomerase PptA (4-oxalocrotonate tautomerase family)
MKDSEIIKEVREARSHVLDQYNGNVTAMLEDMKKTQWKSGHHVVKPPKRERTEGVSMCVYPLKNP